MSPSYPILTAQSEKRGLIVPLFLPLIHEDAIEQLHSSLFVFLSLLYISIDPEFKVENTEQCWCLYRWGLSPAASEGNEKTELTSGAPCLQIAGGKDTDRAREYVRERWMGRYARTAGGLGD